MLLKGCLIVAAPKRSPPTLKAMVGAAQVQRKAGTGVGTSTKFDSLYSIFI
jgi:hypothetical protein